MNRQNIAKLMLCCAPLYACNTTQNRRDPKPNVIYILADDLGYGDIEPYGQEIIKTPHLTQMASEGMMFMQHYAGSTVSRHRVDHFDWIAHRQFANKRKQRDCTKDNSQWRRYLHNWQDDETRGLHNRHLRKMGLGYPESPSIPQENGV